MSLEVAGLLLDTIPDLGDGPVSARLQSAVKLDFDPDDRATVELARLIAGGSFDAVSADRAVLLVDALAATVGVQGTGMDARLSEDLDGTLAGIVEDLERRLSALPYPNRRELRSGIAQHTSRGQARVEHLPVSLVARFTRRVEELEAIAPTPGPSTGDTAPAPSGASTSPPASVLGADGTEGDLSVDAGPSDHPDQAETPAEVGAGAGENSGAGS